MADPMALVVADGAAPADRRIAAAAALARDDAGKNHCPGFHGETAHMLLTERNVKGIGVDTLSLDSGLETHGGAFPVHYAWLGSGRSERRPRRVGVPGPRPAQGRGDIALPDPGGRGADIAGGNAFGGVL